jgi:hypothetical protein
MNKKIISVLCLCFVFSLIVFSGIYAMGGPCAQEGKLIYRLAHPDGSPEYCCAGLIAIKNCNTSAVCDSEDTENTLCTYCGNGICGIGENIFNCPQDCGNGKINPQISLITSTTALIDSTIIIQGTNLDPIVGNSMGNGWLTHSHVFVGIKNVNTGESAILWEDLSPNGIRASISNKISAVISRSLCTYSYVEEGTGSCGANGHMEITPGQYLLSVSVDGRGTSNSIALTVASSNGVGVTELAPIDADVSICTDAGGKTWAATGTINYANWFLWNGCASQKIYAVPMQPIVLSVHGDNCATCHCQYPKFKVYEKNSLDGAWFEVASVDLSGARFPYGAGGTVNAHNYSYTPKYSTEIKIEAQNCFYLNVYTGDLAAMRQRFGVLEQLPTANSLLACGDGICGYGETAANCSQDCAVVTTNRAALLQAINAIQQQIIVLLNQLNQLLSQK